MRFVIDTNIIFSVLLKPENITGALFFSITKEHNLLAPDILLAEISKHNDKLISLSQLTIADMEKIKHEVLKKIIFMDALQIPRNILMKAADLTKDVDINDMPFVALAIYAKAALWTGDKKLYSGLRAKGFTGIINSKEIQSLL